MTEIEGYKVIPLRVSAEAEHCHSVFMKEHFIRLIDPNKPKGRTLFILNIPPYVTTQSLEKFFQQYGPVEFVIFAEKPGRDETEKWHENLTEFSNVKPPFKFKVAYVVFKKSASLGRALEASAINLFSDTTNESFIESGMQLWHTQYQETILDIEQTQKHIEEYMAAYDERERLALEAAKNSAADADGWITVGKQGRDSGFEQKESVLNKLEQKIEKGKKKKELTNFYTFQIRESKMKNILELRKKFEEDKKKIEMIKQTRRFKPF
uniref:RRM domain-containing protein n=1 Tax=Glossina palpalis gambiensis TaxID=67801 RepID=A0A1B0BPM2_9MUSC